MPKKITKRASNVNVVPSAATQNNDEEQIDSRLYINDDLHHENEENVALPEERASSVSSSVQNSRARARQRQHEEQLEKLEKHQNRSSSASSLKKKRNNKNGRNNSSSSNDFIVAHDDAPQPSSGAFSNALEAEILGPLYNDSKPLSGFASPASAEFLRQQHLQEQRLQNNMKETDADALLQQLLSRQSSGGFGNKKQKTNNSSSSNNSASQDDPEFVMNNNNNGRAMKPSSSSETSSSADYGRKNNNNNNNNNNHRMSPNSTGTGGLLALTSPKHHLEQTRKQQQRSVSAASSNKNEYHLNADGSKSKIVTSPSGKKKKIVSKPRAAVSPAEFARRKKERQRELEDVYAPLARVASPPKESLGSLIPTKFILLLTLSVLGGFVYSVIAIIVGAATFVDNADEKSCNAKSPSAGVRPVPYRVIVLASVTSVLVPVMINLIKYRKASVESLAALDDVKTNNNHNNRNQVSKKESSKQSMRKKDLEQKLLETKKVTDDEQKPKRTKIVILTRIVTRAVPKDENSPSAKKKKNKHDDNNDDDEEEEEENDDGEDEEEYYEEEEEYEEEVECSSTASSQNNNNNNNDDEEEHQADDEFSDNGSESSSSNDEEHESNQNHRNRNHKNNTENYYQDQDDDNDDAAMETFAWNERLPHLDSISRKGYKELAWIFQTYATIDARWYLLIVAYTIANFAYNIYAIEDERSTTFAFSNVWDRYQSFYLRWFQSGTVAALGIYFTQMLTTFVCFEIAGTPREIGEDDFLKNKLKLLKTKQFEAADASLMMALHSNNNSTTPQQQHVSDNSVRNKKKQNNNNSSHHQSEDFPSLYIQDEANKVRDMKSLTKIIGNISLPLGTLLVSKSDDNTDTLTFTHVFLFGILLYPGFVTHVLPSFVIFLPVTVLFAIPLAICYFIIRYDLRPFAALIERENGKDALCRRHRISIICAIVVCRVVGTFVFVALCQTMMCYSSMFFSSSKGPYGATIANEVAYRDMDCYLWAMNDGAHDVYHKLQMIGLIFS